MSAIIIVDEEKELSQFEPFQKISRLNRIAIVTEKIDGTNALIEIGINPDTSNYIFKVGSRNKYITPLNDNMGFAQWAYEHRDELITGLGIGKHHGEWWGQGIQRRYGLTEKRFSLFNTFRWIPKDKLIIDPTKQGHPPDCCYVVPILYEGIFNTEVINNLVQELKNNGSVAVPGFKRPEGVVVYHTGFLGYFKVTCEDDESPKSLVKK